MDLPQRAAIVGGGVIGAGWAARLVLHGVDVRISDPDPEVPRRFQEILANAEHALRELFTEGMPAPGAAEFAESVEYAVGDAQLVIESVPERVDLKRDVHRAIEKWAPGNALVTSSTSGIRPSVIQEGLERPERMLVAHPFNPVYLLPLVELCGGEKTCPDSIRRAAETFRRLGMHPLVVRQEVDGFLADRLMEALWREALWLVHDGLATTEEVDDAIRYGAGLRWAMMGTFQTFWLAGGEGGIRAMLQQFGPCLQWPWSHLTDVPELSTEFVDRIADQCEAQARGMAPRDLERVRDAGLVRILQSLEDIGWSAGRTVAGHRALLADARRNSDAGERAGS